MNARRIKKLRKGKGLSQGHFAKTLGTTQATVSRLESGELVARGPMEKLLLQLEAAAQAEDAR